MISLEDFHQDFLQSILSDAQSRGILKPQAFFENVCEELILSGDLTNNYTEAEYTKRGLEIYGWDYDNERQTISLLVHQFFQEEDIQTLTRNLIDTKFNRIKNFYKKCIEGIYQDMEEAFESYSMAYSIYNYKNKNIFSKVRLIILTDGKATRNLKEIQSEYIDNIEIEFRVIDIEYLFKIFLSENQNTNFEVDVDLPYLKVDTSSDDYSAYLSILNGDDLADIYEQFGQKLFEQNVRTFLQFRGKVNKGIRNTIEYDPKKFFAYNNGITATASSLEFGEKGNISKILNFQIVNGGQTTSAIYAARKKSNLNISNVMVQMKLSVVNDKELQDDFVSKVSRSANTQNKVNESDFFSNSPFHKEFKDYSKRIWVSAVGGSQRRTHWFYERVRGEYLNEQAYLSKSQKKQFALENPKKQLIDKTFLSKSENVWRRKPEIVSKGASYSFNEFAKHITDQLEKDDLSITETYFKEAVSRVILFRTMERLVSKAEWYDGGYRAQTVAYTISYLSTYLNKMKMNLNFDLIWELQEIPLSLKNNLLIIAETIYEDIMNPPEGHANIGQWCKKSLCWDRIKSIYIDIEVDGEYLIDSGTKKDNVRQAKKKKKILKGMECQIFVVNIKPNNWAKVSEYYQKGSTRISSMQSDILRKMANGSLNPPSEKQSNILYELYSNAEDEGFLL